MIIVNQDKDEIINFDNIVSIFIADAWEVKAGALIKATDVSKNSTTLGYYKKEERAKEVLEELSFYKAIFEYYRHTHNVVKREIENDFVRDDVMFDIFVMPED